MVGVTSNKEVAGQLATGLFNALDTLNTATSISEDGQTTVAGNASAKEAIAAADDHLKTTVFGQLPGPHSGGRK